MVVATKFHMESLFEEAQTNRVFRYPVCRTHNNPVRFEGEALLFGWVALVS